MTAPPALLDLASAFWSAAGTLEPFPRRLQGPITRALPLTVVSLPGLHVVTIRAWLDQRRIPCPCEVADRSLRACLVARAGHGFVFVDSADPEDEQRFSLAHELAHFLRDYWEPRRRARSYLGEAVHEVLDGKRPPTPAERVNALLAGVPLGFHTHLMHRGERTDPAVEPAEREADRLAWELLAPTDSILTAGVPDRAALAHALQTTYGLPALQAHAYAEDLCPPPPKDAFLQRLRRVSGS